MELIVDERMRDFDESLHIYYKLFYKISAYLKSQGPLKVKTSLIFLEYTISYLFSRVIRYLDFCQVYSIFKFYFQLLLALN
jgi:hypothetical protein